MRKATRREPRRMPAPLQGVLRQDMPYLELNGNTEAVVDGCLGVLEYTDTTIVLNGDACLLRFRGNALSLKAYSASQTEISGEFSAIEFVR